MAPKETTYWVNVYTNKINEIPFCGITHLTEKEAKNHEENFCYLKTISFTIEE